MIRPLSARRQQNPYKAKIPKLVAVTSHKTQKCLHANLLQHYLLENIRHNLTKSVQGLKRLVNDNLEPFRQGLSNFWVTIIDIFEAKKKEFQSSQTFHSYRILGSLSSGQFVNKANPLFDVGMNREELKERIAVIPVYTVTNNKNDIILITSEEKGSQQRVGLLFLEERDALQLIDKLKQENPDMARSSKVVRVGLDDVYDLLTNRRYLVDLEKVIFRFVPDMKQVAYAMDIYHNSGASNKSITGVPIFQAEGLSVASETTKGIPLFLNKRDLDLALTTAARNKYERTAREYQREIDELTYEAEEHRDKAQNAATKKEGQKHLKSADKATMKSEELQKKIDSLTMNVQDTKVEVSSLEEVLSKMERDSQGDLDNVIFVRSGLILEQSRQQQEESSNNSKKNKKAME